MLATALGALLPAVDDACEHGFQSLGLEQPSPDMIGDQMVQLVHWDRATLAAGRALPCLGRCTAKVLVRLPTISMEAAISVSHT